MKKFAKVVAIALFAMAIAGCEDESKPKTPLQKMTEQASKTGCAMGQTDARFLTRKKDSAGNIVYEPSQKVYAAPEKFEGYTFSSGEKDYFTQIFTIRARACYINPSRLF